MDLNTTIVASPDQVSTLLEGQAVILNLKSGMYFGLSAVGARIWGLIERPVAIIDIRDTILGEYEVDPVRCEKDILAILEDMERAGIIEVSHETRAVA